MTMLDLEMNALDAARGLAGLGVNWFIQSSLLIIAGLWIGSALRSKGSAAQSAVYRTTLAAVLVCPLVSWGLAQFGATGWSLEMPAAYTQEEVFSPLPQDADTKPAVELEPVVGSDTEIPSFEELENTARLESSTPNEFPVNERAVDLAPPAVTEEEVAAAASAVPAPTPTVITNWFGISAILAGALWLLTGGWLLARLAHSWRQLIRLRRTAMAADPATIDTCRNVAELFRVAPPTVLLSPFLPSPCLAGLHRPAVLLPDDELSLPMRDVLIHELAHLARGDCYWNLLRRIGTSWLFFQPLMWHLSRRLDSTAEEVCDDYVVEFGGDRREYAHRLVDIAELSVAPLAAAGVGIVSLRSMLAARVARIMDTSRSLSTRVGHALLTLVLVAGLIGTLLVGLVGVEPERAVAEANSEAEAESDESDTTSNSTATTDSTSDDEATATAAVTGTIELIDTDAPTEASGDDDAQPLTNVHGRVVDEAGEPVPGAAIRVMRKTHSLKDEHELIDEQRSGEDGSFEVTMPGTDGEPQWMFRRDPHTTTYLTSIVATAPGYAAAWAGRTQQLQNPNDNGKTGDLVLRLSKQPATIRGQIVNLEGQPVAGASVEVNAVATSEPGAVDKWLATVERLRIAGKLPKPSSMADYTVFTSAMVMDRNSIIPKQTDDPYFPQKYQVGMGHPDFPAAVTTGDEGRFEIAGLAPDQLVGLSISGPGIVTHSIIAVTREMDALDLPHTSVANNFANGYYGATFAHPAAPGVAIAVKLKDAESDEPLAAMGVSLIPVLNNVWTHNPAWHGVTDDDGTIRIEGLPTDTQILLSVDPPHGAPYLAVEHFEVPKGNPLETTEVEIKFRRGVFVRGKVTDAETGEPVDATLHYHPFLDNEHAKNFQRYQTDSLHVDLNNRRYSTGKDGTFEAVVIPGRGILGVHATDRGGYCIGLGAEAIAGLDQSRRFPTHDYCSPSLYHRLLEIDVPADADEVHQDLTVSRGATVKYLMMDDQSQPLRGIVSTGSTAFGGAHTSESEDASIEVKALRPDEKRRVAFLHRERRLGRIIEVTAPQNVSSNVEPQTVSLLPCGTVAGKLVDGEGEPVGNAAISAYTLPLSDGSTISPQNSFTNDKGEFRLEYLPSGATYRIVGNGRAFRFSTELIKELEFKPGETIDLGTIDVTKKVRPEPKRMRPAKSAVETASRSGSVGPSAVTSSPRSSSAIAVRGRVLGVDGEPVAGATVRLSDDEATEMQTATSDSDGRFDIAFDKARFTKPDWHEQAWRFARLLVTAEGFAPAWLEGKDLTDDKVLAVQLKRDDVPIRGQVLTLEGQPVKNARLVIWGIHQPNSGDLDGMFESLRESPVGIQLQVYRNREMSWFRGRSLELNVTRGTLDRTADAVTVTANADGRFEFTGIGPERLVHGRIEGPNIQSVEVSIATRSKVDEWWKREPLNQEARIRLDSGDRLLQIYPSTFEHYVVPSAPIVGVVLDRETGKAIPGIGISGGIRGGGDHANAVTDENGRYELTGLATDGTLRLYAGPADGAKLPYIGVEREVQLTSGTPPQPQDTQFKLTRGIVVRGTVTDASTAKPVKARVEYIAHGSNPLVEEIGDEVYPYGGNITNDQGEFAVVALPGPGALAATTRLASAVPDRYRPAEAEDFGLPLTDEGWISTANHGIIMPIHYKAAQFLNLEPDEKSPVVSLTVKPISDVARVQCVDGQGAPLEDVSVIGHLPWSGKHRIVPSGGLDEGGERMKYFEVAALNEEARQPAIFLHSGSKTAAILFGSKSARQPRLQDLKQLENGVYQLPLIPAATVTGKVVNDDEAAVARASVELHLITDASPTNRTVEVVRRYTDDRGRFELPTIPAGGPYLLAMGGEGFPGGIAKRNLMLTAGQAIDLDSIDITKLDSPDQEKPAVHINEPDGAANKVHGRVIGPNAKPAAGAHVAVIGASNRQRRGGDLDYRDDVLIQTTTNADGNYEITLAGISSKTHTRTVLIARADGAGLTWQHLDPDARTIDASFTLVSEEPIRGQLVDIEGQPAAGVRMSIAAVMPTSKDEKYTTGVGFRDFSASPAAWPKTITTDDDGRFVIHGIPARHGVFINVAGSDRFAPQQISLNSGMPEQRGERDGTYRALVKNLKPGEEAVLALAPAQIFEGVVRYEDTNQPAPHARLTIWASQQKFGSMISVPGKADAQGRYRISPNPGIRFGVTAYPPDGTPYLTRELPAVDWDDAAKVKQVDVTLPKGILVRGKVVESKSGNPVAGATVQYVPESANNSHDADDILTGWQGIQLSNEKGEFEIVVLPGPGNLLVHGPQGEFVLRETSDGQLSRGRPGGQRNYANAIERVDPAVGAEPVEVTIQLQRGAKVTGQLVNEAGDPVGEAILISQLNIVPTTLSWRGDASKQVLGGRFELSPLEPNQNYTVHFLDAKRRLGATATLTAEDDAPTVVLKPCGQATARFVDAAGQPLADFRSSLHMVVSPGASEYDFKAAERGELAANADFVSNIDRTNHWHLPSADKDGRITFPALIPGAIYRITRSELGDSKEFSVESGQSLDLGQIVIDRKE